MKFAFSKVAQAAGVAVLALVGLSASAATQTFTFESNGGVPASPNWGFFGDSASALANTFSLAQFDQSGGDILTGVEIEWGYTGTAALDFLNTSGTTEDVEVTATQKFRLRGWGATGTAAIATSLTEMDTDDEDGFPLKTVGLLDGDTTDFGQESFLLTSGNTVSFSGGAGLAGFVGSGALTYTMGSQGSTTLYAGATGILTAAQLSSAYMTVTYTYTEAPVSSVPEPGSYALMLAGLAAVGAVSRRRRVQ